MIEKNEFIEKYASHLNENQLKAIEATEGPVLLLAVPGSGKTTVLVNRIGYMIFCLGINPENILTLTYTVAATNDMAKRFEGIYGSDYRQKLQFRTINGICSIIISQYGRKIGQAPFELISDEKQTGKILSDILVKNLSEYPTESDVKAAKTLITYCKNMLLTRDEIDALGKKECLPLLNIFTEYNAYLRANMLMDYDDQMIYAYKLLKMDNELLKFYQNKYKYILVDEAQDTSKIQHEIIGLLAGKSGNLFMVGDEDQSIYGFRAAYPEALLNFEIDHPGAKVLIMDKNYRSNANIVATSDSFIQRNRDRHEKHMVATKDAENEVKYIELNTRSNQYNYLLKVAKDCNHETAVLYRDNESVLPLVDLLERENVNYRIKSVDMAFFTHRVVTDITNILLFAINPYDTSLFMKIYFKCQTFLKKNMAEAACRESEYRNIPVLEAVSYVNGVNGMVLGKCKAFATHLKCMLKEDPSKALFRIETPLGYGEYLERNNIDVNKLHTLKMIAANEFSIQSFLERLNYLQLLLQEKKQDLDCNFILSTIHSSKGLEYDEVYLMDVCDGVFPGKVITAKSHATPSDIKEYEEERRLFYVGMTRARHNLNIFSLKDTTSHFVNELYKPARNNDYGSIYNKDDIIRFSSKSADINYSGGLLYGKKPAKFTVDFEIEEGDRIIQKDYGFGVIVSITKDKSGSTTKFKVEFQSGLEKSYAFPAAFANGMKLESRK